MAKLMKEYNLMEYYENLLNKGKKSYLKLWNGEYFNYDINNNTIMADQVSFTIIFIK